MVVLSCVCWWLGAGVLCHSANATNLALNKPTQQSTTYYDGESFRAVDGLTNGYFSQGGVTHTGGLGT